MNELQALNRAGITTLTDVPANIHTGSGDIISGNGSVTVIHNYPGRDQYYPEEINYDYYNLIVVEKQPFTGTLSISKRLALSESITDEVKAVFGKFGAAEREEIYKLPTLIATRNKFGRKADDNQVTMYGFIKKMSIQGDLLRIDYSMNLQLNQQQLNGIEKELQIEYAPDTNEFDKVHYTIKKVNLRRVLGV